MREIVLVTTLVDPIEYTKEQLADVFLKSGNIELDLRSIKVVVQMDALRCQSDSTFTIHVEPGDGLGGDRFVRCS